MPMTQQEATQLVTLVNKIYNTGFDQETAKFWISQLMQRADFEPSKQALDQYINEGNTRAPILPNIIRRNPKKFEFDEPDAKTLEHRRKIKEDPEYRAELKKAREGLKEVVRRYERETYAKYK